MVAIAAIAVVASCILLVFLFVQRRRSTHYDIVEVPRTKELRSLLTDSDSGYNHEHEHEVVDLSNADDGALDTNDATHRRLMVDAIPATQLLDNARLLDHQIATLPNSQHLRDDYLANDEFISIDRFLPTSVVAAMHKAAARLRPLVNRNFVPGFKKGASVSFHTIRELAPELYDVYAHPAMLDLVHRITGSRVQLCPVSDPHACALYYYLEGGDFIDWHYDTSFYHGARYTLLLGIVDRSSSRLVYQLHTKSTATPRPAIVDGELATAPGTMVLFHGDKLRHRVSPCKDGEERIMLSLEYVTNPHMGPVDRIVSTVKDGVGYFGWRATVQALFTKQ